MVNPFQDVKFLGFISQVKPGQCQFHFPNYDMSSAFNHYGLEFSGGVVGNYVVIESANCGYLGKIYEVSLPDKDFLYKSQSNLDNNLLSPVAKIELLLTFDLYDYKVSRSILIMPQIGSKVYVSHSNFFEQLISIYTFKPEIGSEKSYNLNLGNIIGNESIKFQIAAKTIFGRHCAILGTTGGGKSYTVTKLIQELTMLGGKAILLDATGEYEGITSDSVVIGNDDIHIHYSNLLLDDLYTILTPSGQNQKPILSEAIKTLKLLRILQLPENIVDYEKIKGLLSDKGFIIKAKKPKMEFLRLQYKFAVQILSPECNFDFDLLIFQLMEECVWMSDRSTPESWGDYSDKSNIIYLANRINNYFGKHSVLHKVLNLESPYDEQGTDIINRLNKFIKDDSMRLIRISFAPKISSEQNIKEILLNAIGRI